MKSKVILLLSLVMGIVTTALFFNYMKKFDTETVMSESLVEVVVAASEIPINQTISSDMLKVAQVPEKGVHSNTVTDANEIIGKFANANITTGETLLSHHVKSAEEESTLISRKVKDGFRAVSVGVNFVQSVSNLVDPEDKVDVIFSEVIEHPDGTTTVITEQILSNVRVLAVGRKMLPTTSDQEEYVEYSSVTLELEPKDSVKLVNASERGNIQFTIHSKIVPAENTEQEE
jgi:pilus assembly protein CpaB